MHLAALSENRSLRFCMVFMHYLAQGVPLGLFIFAIPAWLSANGASALEIGTFISLTTLPWSLKFVNGFLMDRYTYLAMGRRRAWLIGAQFCMISGLLILAIINPVSTDIILLSWFSFFINVATSYQDVAIDGLAVDLMPMEDRPRANGFMFGGQSLGIAGGTAFSGFIIPEFGVRVAAISIAAFVGLVLILVVVFRERPCEKIFPWSNGSASEENLSIQIEAWLPLLKIVAISMLKGQSLIFCCICILLGVGTGIYYGMMPLIATTISGWSSAEFSGISGTGNVVSGILGVFVLGLIIDRVGWKKALVRGILAMIILITIMIVLRTSWTVAWIISGFVILFISLDTFLRIVSGTAAMFYCVKSVAATQFTLYMALTNLGLVIGGTLIAPLEALWGYTSLMIAIIISCVIGALLVKMLNE